MTWYVSPDFDYPYLTAPPPSAFNWTEPYPTWLWRQSPVYMDGLPFLQPLAVLPIFEVVKQHEYIRLYDASDTDFNTNGLRILSPTSCEIYEELNGAYELTMEHPCDTDGAWRQLTFGRIILARGQAFRIYAVSKNMDSSGICSISVQARHVFYDLNANMISSLTITEKNGQDAIAAILSAAVEPHGFTGSSTISDARSTEFSYNSPTAALMGTDSESFVTKWGGEIDRDNFTFTINARRGNGTSASPAFYINYGDTMQEIQCDIDYTDVCTVCIAVGAGTSITQTLRQPSYPMQYVHKLDCTDLAVGTPYATDIMISRAKKYLSQYGLPAITYTVSIADLRNLPEYADIVNMPAYGVGDVGVVRNAELGITTVQQVVTRRLDAITGDVIKLTLGAAKKSLVGWYRGYSDVMQSEYENEIELSRTWELWSAYTWAALLGYNWGDAKGVIS